MSACTCLRAHCIVLVPSCLRVVRAFAPAALLSKVQDNFFLKRDSMAQITLDLTLVQEGSKKERSVLLLPFHETGVSACTAPCLCGACARALFVSFEPCDFCSAVGVRGADQPPRVCVFAVFLPGVEAG